MTTNCSQLRMLVPDGKIRLRDVMITKDIFRLIELAIYQYVDEKQKLDTKTNE